MTGTVPVRQNQVWFALADAEHCRLFRSSLSERDARHVDEQDALEKTSPEQEHARPATHGGMTHHLEEKERRFAGEIVEWLQRKGGELEFELDDLRATAYARGAPQGPRRIAEGTS